MKKRVIVILSLRVSLSFFYNWCWGISFQNGLFLIKAVLVRQIYKTEKLQDSRNINSIRNIFNLINGDNLIDNRKASSDKQNTLLLAEEVCLQNPEKRHAVTMHKLLKKINFEIELYTWYGALFYYTIYFKGIIFQHIMNK